MIESLFFHQRKKVKANPGPRTRNRAWGHWNSKISNQL